MTVRTLVPDTDSQRVEEIMNGMTDGILHVIAVEVYDTPGARRATASEARRLQVDEGQILGTWVVGRAEEVYAHLAAKDWTDYSLQYEAGWEGDTLPDPGTCDPHADCGHRVRWTGEIEDGELILGTGSWQHILGWGCEYQEPRSR